MKSLLILTSLLLSSFLPCHCRDRHHDDQSRTKRELAKPSWFKTFEAKVLQDLSEIKNSTFLYLQLASNTANQKPNPMNDIVRSLSQGKERAAFRLWTTSMNPQLMTKDERSHLTFKILKKLSLKTRKSVKATLLFLGHIGHPMGFRVVLSKMRTHDWIYGGSEVFILAHNLRRLCGPTNEMFLSLPFIVQDMTSKVVQMEDHRHLYHHELNSTSQKLWVFNLTTNGQFLIHELVEMRTMSGRDGGNEFKLAPLLGNGSGNKTRFNLELVDDETFRIQITQFSGGSPLILGKYLAARNVSDAIKFTVAGMEFQEKVERNFEATKWTVRDPHLLDGLLSGILNSRSIVERERLERKKLFIESLFPTGTCTSF